MIESKDRGGYFGASDTDKIIGDWSTKTFEKWWLQKLSINRDHFDNMYTEAGTYFEHRVLESLGIPMELDKQIIIEDLMLRVNLDGNDTDTNYECKTYKFERGFKMPKKYKNQVQVQMYASGLRKTKIITYGLLQQDYDNFFNPIDPDRRGEHPIAYDEKWIIGVYLPRLTYLAHCLKNGKFPNENDFIKYYGGSI